MVVFGTESRMSHKFKKIPGLDISYHERFEAMTETVLSSVPKIDIQFFGDSTETLVRSCWLNKISFCRDEEKV